LGSERKPPSSNRCWKKQPQRGQLLRLRFGAENGDVLEHRILDGVVTEESVQVVEQYQ